MLRIKSLEPEFVHHLPDVLEEGKLYVSMEFATAAHSCCCGCGNEVATPFAPTDWSMSFDGETVSLHPSIGNWYLPCRSHYFVRKGQVFEARPWSVEEVEDEWQRDRLAKAAYYQPSVGVPPDPDTGGTDVPRSNAISKPSRRWLLRWWRKR